MSVFNILIYRLLLGVNIYIIIWFYSRALTRKYSFLLTFLVYYLCDFVNTTVCADYFQNFDLKGIVYECYNALIVIFMFEGKGTKKLVSAVQVLTAQLLPEVQGFCVLKLLGIDISMIEGYTYMKNLLIIVEMPTMFLVCYSILRLSKGVQFELDQRKVMMIVKCYICEISIMLSMTKLEPFFNPVTSAVILCIKFFIIFLILYLAVLLKGMEAKQLTENRTKYLQQ